MTGFDGRGRYDFKDSEVKGLTINELTSGFTITGGTETEKTLTTDTDITASLLALTATLETDYVPYANASAAVNLAGHDFTTSGTITGNSLVGSFTLDDIVCDSVSCAGEITSDSLIVNSGTITALTSSTVTCNSVSIANVLSVSNISVTSVSAVNLTATDITIESDLQVTNTVTIDNDLDVTDDVLIQSLTADRLVVTGDGGQVLTSSVATYDSATGNINMGVDDIAFSGEAGNATGGVSWANTAYGDTAKFVMGTAGNLHLLTSAALAFSPGITGGTHLGEPNFRWNTGYINAMLVASIATDSGDLTITAAGGNIDFDNENLTTSGSISCSNFTATGSGVISGALRVDSFSVSTVAAGTIATLSGVSSLKVFSSSNVIAADGVVSAPGYDVGGTTGVSFNGAVTNITVVNGLVTAVS
jgi:hypothetical protein